MPFVYQVEGLTKKYAKAGVVANDNLSFAISEGDIFGLLGPNGAGKTTLLKQLLGLLKPTAGTIKLYGMEVTDDPELPSRYVSMMSQRPTALADLTVREALSVTAHLRGQSKGDAKRDASRLIEELELTSISNRVLGKLSGGQQRLVSFGLSMTGYRPVLVLDEPTNDLDPVHRKLLWDKLLWLNREQGTTIILVTHNVIEAERVLHRVGIINKGKIMAIGRVGDLKAQVDDRLRVEIRLKTGRDAATELVGQRLQQMFDGDLLNPAPGYYVCMASSLGAEQAMRLVLHDIGFERLEDFRVVQPTLEDVYLKLGGGEELVKADAS